MTDPINLPLILIAALVASASPGPATLAIAGTSMTHGRRAGLALAAGVTTGSLIWSVAAAFGLGALMLAHSWVFETLRYVGAAYLMYMAIRAARSAWRDTRLKPVALQSVSLRGAFGKGMALHLTNPKAVLFFGALYSIGIPPTATPVDLLTVIAAVGLQSLLVFHGYAILFASPPLTQSYLAFRRWFETVFAMAFAAASLRILTARLG